MKNDRLEQFIRDHREDFDRHYPAPAVWDRISQELDKRDYRHQPKIYTIMKWAASVTVILTVGFALGMYAFAPEGGQATMMANLGQENYQRYQEIENYYTHQVAQKWEEVRSLKQQYPSGEAHTLDEDLQQLDAIFNELKNELMKNHGADEDKIINALIMNYRTKIDILERVADKLKQQEPAQTTRNETVDI